ncbi:hypothetical protein MKW94_009782 [Papaver nudicaule]|uniref:BHLH domain-containing protein n=1 Tax=Papaver nudicaule TaxID=74823 RepID=A0AA41VB62_PAPNU|nr:hypothetical protein [Papaver nudicaule]
MEGLDAYSSFHEEGSMNNPKSKIFDTISSWLELDDPSNIPQELQQLQDLQMLDENFFQFTNTTPNENMEYEHPYSECNLLPYSPQPDSPFLLDLHEFDNNINISQPDDHYYHPVLPGHEVILDQPVDNEAECEKYLNVMDLMVESTPEIIGVDQYFQTDSDNLTTMASVSDLPQQPRPKMQKNDNIEKPSQLSTKRHRSATIVAAAAAAATNTVLTDDDDEGEEIDDEPKRGTLNCKNLVSERNRRKRLSDQLLALRALVPNITKMDKRSVLVDALSYLRSMQQETAKIQKELKEQHLLQQRQPKLMNTAIMEEDEDEDGEHDLGDDTRPGTKTPGTTSQPKPQIIEIDIEKMEEKRFIVKITCKGSNGTAGDVFRAMESIGFDITYSALDQIEPQHFLSTAFIKFLGPSCTLVKDHIVSIRKKTPYSDYNVWTCCDHCIVTNVWALSGSR